MITSSRRTFIAGAASTALLGPSLLRAAPSTGELRDDIAIVRRALALHPGLYRYRSPAATTRALDRLDQQFTTASGPEQRFLILSAFLATIRCGHSQCNPYNQSKATVAALFDRPTRLPFTFAWIDRRMIVLADHGGSGDLAPGTEILAIDGQPAAHLLGRLLPYARADGHNDAKRVAQMEMRGTDRFETFDIFQGLLAPPRAGRFTIDARAPDGRVQRRSVAALTQTQRLASRRTIETSGATRPFWTWAMEDGIATLTMPSWVMYNSAWDWRAWLDDRLASLKGARGLILDLRDNEGGNECGNAILARLAGQDLAFTGYRQLVRYRRTPADLDRYLDTWDDSFRTIGAAAVPAGDGFFELGQEETDRIAARGPRIALRVAALVGPTCSSATFSFARRAQESGLVRLFGEPTGGNLRGINGNGYFFVRLPGSGLEFDLPIVGNFPAGAPRPDRGVLPDVAVRPTQADIAAGRDRCAERAQAWIRS